MHKLLLGVLLIALSVDLHAQVGINTTDPKQELDINGHLRVRDLSQSGAGLAGGSLLFTEADGTVVGLSSLDLEVDSNNNINIGGGRFYRIAHVDVGSGSTLDNLDLDLDGANRGATMIVLTGSSGSDIEISGIKDGVDGRHIIIVNDFSKKITIKDQDGGSDAENRIDVKTSTNVTNDNVGSMELVYDGTINRWILFKLID